MSYLGLGGNIWHALKMSFTTLKKWYSYKGSIMLFFFILILVLHKKQAAQWVRLLAALIARVCVFIPLLLQCVCVCVTFSVSVYIL